MASPTTPANLVEALTEHHLLEDDQLEVVTTQLQPRFTDPRALAGELVRRGWLTPFQAEAILRGHAGSLSVGPYVLLDKLGEGGMGSVFRARHRLMKRVVALKLIRKGHLPHPEAIRRFQQEIQAAAQLSHPNIVIAHDAGRVSEHHYFAMEYVEGKDLGQILAKHGPFPVAFACECARQAALGLQHAHEKGLVHRDIKPQNLLLTNGVGGQKLVKILDMGLARVQYDPANKGSKALTQLGAVMGSPNYIAPEQAMDSHKVDTRADLYSLGCSLYELLTGKPPFSEGSLFERLEQHLRAEPRPIRDIRPEVPPDLAAVVAKLLAKRVEDRYQTPKEAAAALAPFCQAEASRAPAAAAAVVARPPTAAASPAAEAIRTVANGSPPVAVPAAAAPPAAEAIRPAANSSPPIAAPLAAGLPPGVPAPSNPDVAPIPTPDVTRPPSNRRFIVVGSVVGVAVGVLLWLLLGQGGGTTPGEVEKKGPSFVTNSLGMKLARIPAGDVTLGSPPTEEGHAPSEGPQCPTRITRPFLIGAYEVTQSQYQKVMGSNPSYFEQLKRAGPDYPVENVSWSQAVEFCHRLSELPEEKAANRVYRLPTSAEWEYVCRAGTTTPFHFGPKVEAVQANFDASARYGGAAQGPKSPGTVKVGTYPQPNGFGVEDMHGNVAEWCHDWFDPDYYKNCPREDPEGPVLGAARVVRGGGWVNPAVACRSASRVGSGTPTSSNVGFRVVCEEGGEWFPRRTTPGQPIAVTFDPQYLDRLDPAKLPPENRFEGQPKPLRWVLGEHRVRHADQVNAVAVAPDESVFVTGGRSDGMIRFGDAATLRELRTIKQPGGGVWALRFSPDGKVLASGSAKGPVYLWDPTTGEQLKELTSPDGHRKAVVALAFSPDGKKLVSGSQDGSAIVWELESGRWKQLVLGSGGARSVEFSADGKTLLTGGNAGDGTVRLWDVKTWKDTILYDAREKKKATFVSAALAPDGKHILTGASDRKMILWDAHTRQKVVQKDVPPGIQSVAFAPDGATFATATNNQVQIRDRAKPEKPLAIIPGFTGQTNVLTYYPKSKRLLIPSGDTVTLWEIQDGKAMQIRPVYGHRSEGTTVAFSSDGRYVTSGSARDRSVRLWDLQSGKEVSFAASFGLSAFSPDGRYVLLQESGFPEVASMLGVVDQRPYRRFQGEMSGFVGAIAVSADRKLAAAGGRDNIVRVWEVETGRQVGRFPGQPAAIRGLVFAPAGQHLFAGYDGARSIRLWDLVTGNLEGEYAIVDGLTSRLAISRDGKTLVAGSKTGAVLVWDAKAPGKAALEFRRHKGPVTAVALGPDGKQLVSAGQDGKVLLWETGKDNPVTLAEMPWPVPDVSVSADGRYVAYINTHLTGTVYILRVPGKGG